MKGGYAVLLAVTMVKTVNFRAAAFAATGLISGILYSYFRVIGNDVNAVFTAVAAVLAFIVFTYFSSAEFKSAGRVLCFLIFTACVVTGGLAFRNVTEDYKNADLGGYILTVSGKVNEISEKENYTHIVLKDVCFSGAVSGKSRYKTAVIVYGDNSLRLGDEIEFTAAVRDRTLIYNGRLSASALTRGVKYFAEVNAVDVIKTASNPDIFQKCHLYILDTLRSGLKEKEFPIAHAMLTGNSDYMNEETIFSYREAGIAHIFAVSGLHIGFLAASVYFVLNKLRVNKFAAFLMTLFIVVFYSGVCGFSTSSLRAVIMFLFLNIAKLFGFRYDGISSVFSAAFLILLVSPAQLFCAGFLLSFSVVMTVVILYNPLKRLLKFLPDKVSAPLVVSLSAELGSAPVLLYFFGAFPALSLFVNVLFIPVAGALFIALVLCTLLGCVFPPDVVLFLPDKVIFGVNYFIALLDFKAFLVGGFTLGAFSTAYYGAIVVTGGLINLRKTAKAFVCVLLSVTVVFGTWIKTLTESNKIKATVVGDEKISAAVLTWKNENLLIISDISYKNFSENRLSNALSGVNGAGVTVVLMKQDRYVDMVTLSSRLYNVTEDFRLYYYGERDESAENIINKTFGVFALNLKDGDVVPDLQWQCVFALGGKCLCVEFNGYTVAVFASLDEGTDYRELAFSPRYLICLDKHDELSRYFAPETVVSFRYKYGYPDGETYGNYAFAFS